MTINCPWASKCGLLENEKNTLEVLLYLDLVKFLLNSKTFKSPKAIVYL